MHPNNLVQPRLRYRCNASSLLATIFEILNMVTEFGCRRCGIVVPLEEYESDRLCPSCGTLLPPKRLKIDKARKKKERVEIHQDDINIDSL
jgi:predicted RNA-binding Zn-ribbon protein involved in translation (DUF1610 family)